MITDEDKERVRQATDFVTLVSETVELKPRGQDYWGSFPPRKKPFIQDKSFYGSLALLWRLLRRWRRL